MAIGAEYFEMTSDEELTLKGFYSLHEMTANDSEGGVEELCDVLTAMGYDPTLKLRYVSLFKSAHVGVGVGVGGCGCECVGERVT